MLRTVGAEPTEPEAENGQGVVNEDEIIDVRVIDEWEGLSDKVDVLLQPGDIRDIARALQAES